MTTGLAILLLLLPSTALIPVIFSLLWRLEGRNRLLFFANTEVEEEREEVAWEDSAALLTQLGDRFGKAGFVSTVDRQRGRAFAILFISGGALFATIAAVAANTSIMQAIFLMFGGAYLGFTGFAFFLRYHQREHEREVMFQMPIFLESLILLVESGLGILPALERVVPGKQQTRKISPVTRLFQLVYQLSASGMPFTQALETVAEVTPQRIVRHVLLHLDISGTEGGELVPSLRNLSDHAHMEWKLSVEQRVRRLENLVVFPVFASVLGLMFLTAAVPVVPLLDLKDILDKKPDLAAQGSQLTQSPQPLSSFPMRGN